MGMMGVTPDNGEKELKKWGEVAKNVNNVFRKYFGQEESKVEFSQESIAKCVSKVLIAKEKGVFDPKKSWESWKEERRSQGWTHGEYDQEKKTHPNLIENYEDLPFEEKVKDYTFHAVILALHEANLKKQQEV